MRKKNVRTYNAQPNSSNNFQTVIGFLEDVESDAILYIIPRLNSIKYIKVTKENEKDFENIIDLFIKNEINDQMKGIFDEKNATEIRGGNVKMKNIEFSG